ncbi:hypothetical protein GXW78_23585 [Roseomonas terrae]|jgi:hypothetical protein|uniref:Lipoprotein n=1 Tax=Neoroseomonas terrae TaxID=424799 RepID=A0ABS5ENQ7_9PROT|nr:hypothetical protein [Neoroseomonas terrae]MBR0652660.1 hypothetical protein [Neoroseomonas terrae]
MLQRREMLRGGMPALVAVGASLGLGACREAPIYESVGGQFPGNGNMADRESQIRRAAATQTGWTVQPVRYGLLRATNSWRSHQMTVDISYDVRTFSIRYVNSVNLDYDGARIHAAYNDRVRALEGAILRTQPDTVSRATPAARTAPQSATASARSSRRLTEGVSELPVGSIPDGAFPALPAGQPR